MRVQRPEEYGLRRIYGTGSSVGPDERDVAKVPARGTAGGRSPDVLGQVHVRHGPHPLSQVQAEAAGATADVNDGVVGICARPTSCLQGEGPVARTLARCACGPRPLLHVAVLSRAAVAF